MEKTPAGFGDGSLVPFVEEAIWTATTPVRFLGSWFPHVMTVVRLNEGDLLLHSPCHPSRELVAKIETLGRVTHVVAPNWFHDLYLAEYRKLFPQATFWAPERLQQQQQSIVDRVLNEDTPPPWFDQMPHIAPHGLLTFGERIFFHRQTRTLIVADFLMNVRANDDAPAFTKFGYKLFGLNGDLQVLITERWFGFPWRASMRDAARSMLAWNPERLIVGHGVPLKEHAGPQLRQAFDWLHP